ncbi:BamA/TamA family outer membrane protein [Paraferrimonas sp. SM1919]|uniref:BamA/TamA family outer membrane protein n=1 Tax=Paraferrimonas sp. SM1919 TaxID=2662263 RepID=UPI0013D8DFBF|nr:BamA/TamA family outer membrane protein [Paraferrimonas sp. SM1919]
MIIRLLSITVVFLCLSTTAQENAQASKQATTQGLIDSLLNELGLDDPQFDPNKGLDFSILPGPFYTPETSLGVGISAVGMYAVDKQDLTIQPSSLVITGLASVNGAFGLYLNNSTYFRQDKHRIYAYLALSARNETYYGTGYAETVKQGIGIDYHHNKVHFSPSYLYSIFDNFYIGPGYHFSYSDVGKPQILPNGIYNDEVLNYPDSGRSSGFKIRVLYDSRDLEINASKGALVELQTVVFNKNFGSEFQYSKTTFKYNGYLQLTHPNQHLAWQFVYNKATGDVPWTELPMLGGNSGLRGYYQQRYRGDEVALSQLEYRRKLSWRHGLVAWVGLGMIRNRNESYDFSKTLPNIGVGYRFEVKPRVNVRFDLGIGQNEMGFYMDMGEAF